MKIVQINTFSYKATGSIMMNIHNELSKVHDSYVVWGRGRDSHNSHEIVIADNLGIKLHGFFTRITDKTGFGSKSATKRLVLALSKIQPDIIHLHNIHGYYLNIEILFKYIRENNIKVVWTFHDCWPFTGHCAYFDLVQCNKWETGCYKCPQKNTYPSSFLLDNSKFNWNKKKELFSKLDITIVTPCKWLRNLVSKSFLGSYPCKVIYNGIDTTIFRPTQGRLKDKYNMFDKQMILGVASEWTKRKGLHDFIKLSNLIDEKKYKIIIVGLTKKQIQDLPDNILGIERTSNVAELVELYTMADYYFNPTYEDNFPTTNLEAIACGTPVITYDTGGCPEAVSESNGWVIEKGDLNKVVYILNHNSHKHIEPIENIFIKENMIQNYLKLYNELFKEKKIE